MPKGKKKEETKIPKKMGRPTVWQDDYVNQALAFGAGSATDLAIHFNVCRETIWDWAKNNPDFSHALKRCLALREQNIIAGALSNQYNAGFAKFLLSAQHGVIEKSEVKNELVGKDGAELQAPVFNIAFPNASKT